jgi:hypothetical protein
MSNAPSAKSLAPVVKALAPLRRVIKPKFYGIEHVPKGGAGGQPQLVRGVRHDVVDCGVD